MSDRLRLDQYSIALLQLQQEVNAVHRYHRIRGVDYAERLLGSPGARFRGLREYCNLVRSGRVLKHNFLIDRRGHAGRQIPAKPARGNYSLWCEISRYSYLEALYWLLPDDELAPLAPPPAKGEPGFPANRPLIPDLRDMIFRNPDDFRAGNWRRHYDIWLDMVQFLP